MALSTETKADIAYKNLFGKSQTSDAFELGNENYGIGFEVQSKDVTIDKISATNSQVSVQNGIAIKLRVPLDPYPDSGGKAFLAKWPANITTSLLESLNGGDPNNNLSAFEYGEGSLKGIKSGDRITNLISNSIFGDYRAIPRDSSGNEIAPADPRLWVFQYNSGIFYQDTANASPTPATIDVYYYIGTRLSDLSSKTQTNIRISATGSDSYYATYSSPMIDEYSSNYIFLIDFANNSTGSTVSLNINSIGTYAVYKPSQNGPTQLQAGDIIGATGGTAGPIYYLVYNNSAKYFEFFYSTPVSNSGNFTNPTPTNYNVGGVERGYSFNDVKFLEMFKDIFYPENMGRIATFSMKLNNVDVSKTYEVGETFSGGLYYTFSWAFDNGSDFKDRTLRIEDVTNVTQSQTYWQPPSATPFTQSSGLTGPVGFLFANPINTNVPNKRTFRLSVERTNGTRVFKDYDINWTWKVYHGGATSSTLTSNQIINLNNKTLASQSKGSWSLPGGGYKYIAFPNDVEYDFTSINYQGLPFAIAGTPSGYSFSVGDLNYLLATVSSIRGIDKRYRIYRSKNEMNATFSVNIS